MPWKVQRKMKEFLTKKIWMLNKKIWMLSKKIAILKKVISIRGWMLLISLPGAILEDPGGSAAEAGPP